VSRRRSNRLSLQATVEVSTNDNGISLMQAIATNLNRYGARVEVNRELQSGSTIIIRNKAGFQASARIIGGNTTDERLHAYGIEFVDPDEQTAGFWGIFYPSTEDFG
jgi:hypothetical protein